jgi:hypothetical protein
MTKSVTKLEYAKRGLNRLPRVSKFAVLSFSVGLASGPWAMPILYLIHQDTLAMVMFFGPAIAIVTGWVSFVRIGRSRGYLSGEFFAIFGFLFGVLSLLGWAVR